MRTRLIVLAVASLAAFSAASAETSELQPVQGQESAAEASAPAAREAAEPQTVPATASAEAAAASAAAPEAASASVKPADPSMPQDAAASEAITLKMATVPPPADFKIPAGYRPVKRGLDTVYCTDITPIGSRMSKRYCMSREQVEEQERQAEIARRDVVQKAGKCVGGGCGGS